MYVKPEIKNIENPEQKKMKVQYISIVIPVFNSEKTIEEVLKKIRGNLISPLKYEVILVNDGSADNSYFVCKKLAHKYKNVKFINLSKNFGQPNAILAGLKYAAGEFIVFMDDDLQTPPEQITRLLDKICEGYDVVFANYIKKKHDFLRRLYSRINNFMAERLLGKPKGISTTSYCIIRRYIAKELLKYHGPYPFISGLLFRTTSNISKIDVPHNKRNFGKSNYNFFKLFKLWLNGFTNFSIKPLRISFLLGFLISFSAFVLVIVLFVRRFLNPGIFIGWTSTIITILFFSGIQLITLGLAGEYIGRIFLTQNRHPQYVIKEKFNIKEDE